MERNNNAAAQVYDLMALINNPASVFYLDKYLSKDDLGLSLQEDNLHDQALHHAINLAYDSRDERVFAHHKGKLTGMFEFCVVDFADIVSALLHYVKTRNGER